MKKLVQHIVLFFKRILLTIRLHVLQFALNLRARMRKESLREAIVKADSINKKTGRKVLVPFDGNDYHTLQKKQLKKLSNAQRGKRGRIKHDQIKQLEKRSVYVAG